MKKIQTSWGGINSGSTHFDQTLNRPKANSDRLLAIAMLKRSNGLKQPMTID
jgi:hypothetical protein